MAVTKILEKDIEAYLKDRVREMGWGIHKNISDPRRGGTPGMPDDTIILADREVAWVECKNPQTIGPYLVKRAAYLLSGTLKGCSKTEVNQFREQEKLIDLKHRVHVVGTHAQVSEVIRELEIMYG